MGGELEPVPAMTGMRPCGARTAARHDLHVLVVFQGGGFTGGTHRHDGVGALGHMPVQQPSSAAKSTRPSSAMGVTSATMLPWNIRLTLG